jgi:hypothetical protein
MTVLPVSCARHKKHGTLNLSLSNIITHDLLQSFMLFRIEILIAELHFHDHIKEKLVNWMLQVNKIPERVHL